MAHIDRHHRITLAGPIDQIFPLFTPKGETRWVEGWEPQFLHPENGDTQQDMVFRTVAEAEETLWACIDWNPSRYRVRYVRVTPGSRFGFVGVACHAVSPEATEVAVNYQFTALTTAGQSYLANLTADAFAVMIDGWQQRITRYLQDRT